MKIQNAKIRINPDEVEIRPSTKRVSLFLENQRQEISWIDINQLVPYRHQARQVFDETELQNLAHSIKSHGIRQPLTVMPSSDKENIFEVVSGERRLRAARIAQLNLIPCIIIYDEKKAEEIAIIENIHRQDLSPLELGRAYTRLLSSGICSSKKEIAERLGVARTKVIDCMNLCELPNPVQRIIVERAIVNRDFLREICQLSSESEMIGKIDRAYPNLTEVSESEHESVDRKKRRNFILQFYIDNNEIEIVRDKVSRLSPDHKIKLVEQMKKIIQNLD